MGFLAAKASPPSCGGQPRQTDGGLAGWSWIDVFLWGGCKFLFSQLAAGARTVQVPLKSAQKHVGSSKRRIFARPGSVKKRRIFDLTDMPRPLRFYGAPCRLTRKPAAGPPGEWQKLQEMGGVRVMVMDWEMGPEEMETEYF